MVAGSVLPSCCIPHKSHSHSSAFSHPYIAGFIAAAAVVSGDNIVPAGRAAAEAAHGGVGGTDAGGGNGKLELHATR